MNIILGDVKANQDKFEAIHRDPQHISASRAASCLGLNPYSSPLQEWIYDTGKAERPDISKEPRVRKGLLLEPLLWQMYDDRNGGSCHPYNQIIQHEEIPWLICTPDAKWVGLGAAPYRLVEGKVYSWRSRAYWQDGGAPNACMIQAQIQLNIDGDADPVLHFAALVGEDEFYQPAFNREPSIFAQIVEGLERYRKYVKDDIPPDAGAGDSKLVLELTQPRSEQVKLNLDREIERYKTLQAELKVKNAESKKLDDEVKALKNTILLRMNGATHGVSGQWNIKATRSTVTVRPSSYEKVMLKIWGESDDSADE